ncbi:50S ribosomal protein L23 [Crocinitomicaceae bacterium CZZ-1]|uniref:Large ribosomal subunit protein uL23 n=1 Tax=Taishania pollutisoli TaxID=2766479 RepID=A0A8J6PA98_9FLAO|nr:50S ribosomal protein L23 [Taishania pollutisoli]MBC9811608.1 50S ribosomal protein L23 [Taishania pollutisoli]MBX2948457.1 50S ribosomal protein L23 [Crocinitomicaceae bacterium]NGF75555.1 50S ribosomal protein L23 [Fluviicola sp. SGL-29]
MKAIIKKPVITEKATGQSEKANRFSFVVDRAANKLEIKDAVEKLYGVQVTEVRTMNYGGGKSSVKYTNRGVVEQRSKQWKKAVVTVADGETIDLFSNF